MRSRPSPLAFARSSVLGMVLREGFRLTTLGLAIGLAAGLAMTRYLQTLLYEVEPADPAVFAYVSELLVIEAAAACHVHASRAMRVDPNIALKYE